VSYRRDCSGRYADLVTDGDESFTTEDLEEALRAM